MNPLDDAWRNQPRRPGVCFDDVVTGLVVIGIGLLFLAANLGFATALPWLDNWWALFILVGAAAPARRAMSRYLAIGRIDAIVASWLLTAAATALVALIFLLGLSFARWWPLFVIIGGFYAMLPDRRRHRDGDWQD